MIEWRYMGAGWLDVWTEPTGRCMIARHPRKHNGRYVIWLDGRVVCTRDEVGFAKWKAWNLLQQENAS